MGKEVAVKKMIVQSFENSEVEENEFKKEVKIMSSLRHPNLLLMMGATLKPGNMMMGILLFFFTIFYNLDIRYRIFCILQIVNSKMISQSFQLQMKSFFRFYS